MCLVTKKKNPKMAKKDIIVWKILRSDLSAIYQSNFYYERDKLNKTKFKYESYNNWWVVFDKIIRVKLRETFPNFENDEEMKRKMMSVSEGFHSLLYKKDAKYYISVDGMARDNDGKIFKAIIPKGAEYIKDGYGQIVSNQLIIL